LKYFFQSYRNQSAFLDVLQNSAFI